MKNKLQLWCGCCVRCQIGGSSLKLLRRRYQKRNCLILFQSAPSDSESVLRKMKLNRPVKVILRVQNGFIIVTKPRPVTIIS
jgi:hypothetical protein